jgi:hypothetical protein
VGTILTAAQSTRPIGQSHRSFISHGITAINAHRCSRAAPLIVDDLIDEPFNYELRQALDQWRELVVGQPRIAREQFGWELEDREPDMASTLEGSES